MYIIGKEIGNVNKNIANSIGCKIDIIIIKNGH